MHWELGTWTWYMYRSMDLWRCSVAQTPQNGRINKDNGDIGSSQLPSTRRRRYPVARLLHRLALLYY